MSNSESFLPDNYEVPKSDGSYLKFVPGENKFRILSKPIIGWVDWKDKKPYRFTMDKKPSTSFDPKQEIKHFWAFVVWDYVGKKISILEIDKKGIQNSIQALQKNPDWGSPFNYDITVTKSGSGMETKYVTTPLPPKAVHQKIAELYADTPIDLNALFDGKDPFDTNKEAPSDYNKDEPVSANNLPDEDDLPF